MMAILHGSVCLPLNRGSGSLEKSPASVEHSGAGVFRCLYFLISGT